MFSDVKRKKNETKKCNMIITLERGMCALSINNKHIIECIPCIHLRSTWLFILHPKCIVFLAWDCLFSNRVMEKSDCHQLISSGLNGQTLEMYSKVYHMLHGSTSSICTEIMCFMTNIWDDQGTMFKFGWKSHHCFCFNQFKWQKRDGNSKLDRARRSLTAHTHLMSSWVG